MPYDYNSLSPVEKENYRLDFLIDNTFSELYEIHSEMPLERKELFLAELSSLVVQFSPLFFGGPV